MIAGLFVIFWLVASAAAVGLLVAHMVRTVDRRNVGAHRRESELHRGRAEAEAEIEEHDIDDMLDAVAEYRRRAGRRDIGEELADELLRSTWTIDPD